MTLIDVLQQLNLNGKDIPVIMITGIGDEQLVVHAMRLGICDMSIVRSMALLSDSMGLRVVAEGVESSENWSVPTDLECRYGQGYLIGRPMAPDQYPQCYRANR